MNPQQVIANSEKAYRETRWERSREERLRLAECQTEAQRFAVLVELALQVSLQWALDGASAYTHLDYMSWHKVPENDPINERHPWMRFQNRAYRERTAKYNVLTKRERLMVAKYGDKERTVSCDVDTYKSKKLMFGFASL